MIFDLLLCLGCGVFLLVGALTGAARQLVRLGALATAYVAARLAPAVFVGASGEFAGQRGLVADIFAGAAAGTVVYIAASMLGGLLAGWMERGDSEFRKVNRFLGAVIGGAKGIFIAYLLACAAVLFESPIESAFPGTVRPGSSAAADWARQHNLLMATFAPGMRQFREAGAAGWLAGGPTGGLPLLGAIPPVVVPGASPVEPKAPAVTEAGAPPTAPALPPGAKPLLQNPHFAALIQSGKAQKALENGNIFELLKDQNVAALLRDPAAVAALGHLAAAKPPLPPPAP